MDSTAVPYFAIPQSWISPQNSSLFTKIALFFKTFSNSISTGRQLERFGRHLQGALVAPHAANEAAGVHEDGALDARLLRQNVVPQTAPRLRQTKAVLERLVQVAGHRLDAPVPRRIGVQHEEDPAGNAALRLQVQQVRLPRHAAFLEDQHAARLVHVVARVQGGRHHGTSGPPAAAEEVEAIAKLRFCQLRRKGSRRVG